MARGGTAVILKGDVVSSAPDDDRLVVALKVVVDVAKDDSHHYHERIRRELAAVQQIEHRFILPFLGVVMGSTYTILVSQFMENGDLLEYLKSNPGARRRPLIIQVADAVNYLHTRAGLVHGDLKCQNVLVSPHGDAQLADFGLSTIVDKSRATDTTTLGIRQSYTLQFAAPELLSDEAKAPSGKTRSKTPQTDVFAFGRLVLQAFSGTVPWPDLPLHAVFHKVLRNTTPERPDASALGLSDQWWSVCVSCWQSKPRERPTMGEIMLELSETSDQARAGSISGRKPLKPWSLPPIFTKRARPQDQPVAPLKGETTVELVSEAVRSLSLNAPDGSGAREHTFKCQHCRHPIVGVRYQCAICTSYPDSYNLCATCETKSYIVHDSTHIFFKLPRPVKRRIRDPSPFVPHLYRRRAGLFPDGSSDDARPEAYLSTVLHEMALCDRCMQRIVGKWYRCAYCGKDLCDACEAIDDHDDTHLFVVFKAVLDIAQFRDFTDLERPAPLIQYSVY
ncbi:kinase-like protein [Auricularia subglabra TFB-10046 SS5]|nr:kinase-like protein [Auricularia subglabra TFB-10046 SS5]